MTLMQEAKCGRVAPEIESAARREGLEPEKLARLVAAGRVVIPRNIRRERPGAMATGIGEMLTTKVNVNVGTSQSLDSPENEVEKARAAVAAGADAVMDLSTGGDLDLVRCQILRAVSVPVGTVPLYNAAVAKDLSSQGFFNALEKHAKDGVDFVTVHVGVNKNSLERLANDPRIMGVVSRGGSLTMKYISETGEDNPYYKEYDYLLAIAREYDLAGELVKRAREAGVQAMVEGPGHVPADEIETSVKAMKHLTDGAPLYLLGPLVTDIAPGYDHITAAMGGVIAGMAGADFLCATTPSEHLDLPTKDDVIEGTYVTRIAAHAADLTRPGVRDRARAWDLQMAKARADLDWQGQFQSAINPDRARQIRHRRGVETDTCTMCSELCAIRLAKEAMEKGVGQKR
ncbi:MAG: phosphomethylpyrimidine synthase ThiC [Methanothrix sp.]|nr:phosphomethylpyrimidine synthase ThiC [Methanothrix sp.]OYV09654.1 MAG: thiamine biosynthesis protein ThiC [Methanosaeta sp. NSP1]